MLSLVYLSSSGWNEPQWKNDKFDNILSEARGELNEDKRRELYCDAQRILKVDGPSIIPIFYDWLDGKSSKVKNLEPHPHGSIGFAEWDDVWIDA